MISIWQIFKRQVARDYLIQKRQPKYLINAALFFFMVIVFFPLTLTPDPALLKTIAPGLLWMSALLASMLSAERFFDEDSREGVIEQWVLSGQPLSIMVMAKLLVHWCYTLFAIVILIPLLALLFHFTCVELMLLLASLLLGTPVILALCALASAFSVGLQQKGILVSLIVLPLTLPVMIFGTQVTLLAGQEGAILGIFAVLTAISLLAITLLPFAIAAVLRVVV